MKGIYKQILLVGVLLTCLLTASCALAGGPGSFIDLSGKISGDKMYDTAKRLSSIEQFRVAGLEGEKLAGNYIADRFHEMGLPVERQTFPLKTYRYRSSEVTVTAPYEAVLESHSLMYSKTTSPEGVSGEVVYAGLGSEEEMAGLDVKGKIVLMRRGGDFFWQKTKRAYSHGATGVIYFNPEAEDLVRATLVTPSSIPALSIHRSDGERIQQALSEGATVRVTIKEDSETKDGSSENIIARLTPSSGPQEKTIIIGAHYDGVDAAAANDNASGVAVLLEAARLLAQQKLQCNVVFVAFGAEEVGTVGSRYYVSQMNFREKANTVGMLNLDMVGRGDTWYVFTVNEDAKSLPADLAVQCMGQFGYKNKRIGAYGSDHVAFEGAGISVAGFEGSPDPDYHTVRDSLDKLEKEDLIQICKVVTAVALKLDQSVQVKK